MKPRSDCGKTATTRDIYKIITYLENKINEDIWITKMEDDISVCNSRLRDALLFLQKYGIVFVEKRSAKGRWSHMKYYKLNPIYSTK
jgi:hypothetical protein